MTATSLLVWGLVAHFIADWLLQNEWMAVNKMNRAALYRSHGRFGWSLKRGPADKGSWITDERDWWWLRHPAAYVHAGIHGVALAFVFGWVAIPLALSHLLIDTRKPVVVWSRLIRQTQPSGKGFDIGADVRIWTDQVWHIVAIAIAAGLVAS